MSEARGATDHPLFPFHLFSTILEGHEAHKEPLIREILEHQRHHPGLRRSNRRAWHSGPEFVAAKSAHVAWVLDGAMAFARDVLAPLYGGWVKSEPTLGSYWANVLGPGGFNAPHHHHPQHWSAAYYVAVPDLGDDPDDPAGRIEFLNPTPWNTLAGSKWSAAPREGEILMFPSSLVHFVHPHASDRPRISIAFNLNVVPKRPG